MEKNNTLNNIRGQKKKENIITIIVIVMKVAKKKIYMSKKIVT